MNAQDSTARPLIRVKSFGALQNLEGFQNNDSDSSENSENTFYIPKSVAAPTPDAYPKITHVFSQSGCQGDGPPKNAMFQPFIKFSGKGCMVKYCLGNDTSATAPTQGGGNSVKTYVPRFKSTPSTPSPAPSNKLVSSALLPHARNINNFSSTLAPNARNINNVSSTSAPNARNSNNVASTSAPNARNSNNVSSTSAPNARNSNNVSSTSAPNARNSHNVSSTSAPNARNSSIVTSTSVPLAQNISIVSSASVPVARNISIVSSASVPAARHISIVSSASVPVARNISIVSSTSVPAARNISIVSSASVPAARNISIASSTSVPHAPNISIASPAPMPPFPITILSSSPIPAVNTAPKISLLPPFATFSSPTYVPLNNTVSDHLYYLTSVNQEIPKPLQASQASAQLPAQINKNFKNITNNSNRLLIGALNQPITQDNPPSIPSLPTAPASIVPNKPTPVVATPKTKVQKSFEAWDWSLRNQIKPNIPDSKFNEEPPKKKKVKKMLDPKLKKKCFVSLPRIDKVYQLHDGIFYMNGPSMPNIDNENDDARIKTDSETSKTKNNSSLSSAVAKDIYKDIKKSSVVRPLPKENIAVVGILPKENTGVLESNENSLVLKRERPPLHDTPSNLNTDRNTLASQSLNSSPTPTVLSPEKTVAWKEAFINLPPSYINKNTSITKTSSSPASPVTQKEEEFCHRSTSSLSRRQEGLQLERVDETNESKKSKVLENAVQKEGSSGTSTIPKPCVREKKKARIKYTPPIQRPLNLKRNEIVEHKKADDDCFQKLSKYLGTRSSFVCLKCGRNVDTTSLWVNVIYQELCCEYCIKNRGSNSQNVDVDNLLEGIMKSIEQLNSSDSEPDDFNEKIERIKKSASLVKSQIRSKKKRRKINYIGSDSNS